MMKKECRVVIYKEGLLGSLFAGLPAPAPCATIFASTSRSARCSTVNSLRLLRLQNRRSHGQ